jgi:hypothetical protein
LLVLLLIVESGLFLQKVQERQTSAATNFKAPEICDTCKPDIFFIILDEYAGNITLSDLFDFDNRVFLNELQKRGFHIVNESRSNYNYTPFSIASILNMDYLKLDMEAKGNGNLKYCYEKIKSSNVLKFLNAEGYKFYNYSIFDFPGQPAPHYDSFLPRKSELITSQTFISRIVKDIQFNIATGKFPFKAFLQKLNYDNLHNNNYIIKHTIELAGQNNLQPKFVYAHLIMPHYPYYFNSKGKPLAIGNDTGQNMKDYIEYLQYCNQQILQLVDHLLSASSKPPVIMLLGDHGFRHFTKKQPRRYYFLNLNAVLLPNKNYKKFYDGITGVNQFRVLLNTQFNAQLPLIKDSTIYLWE